MGYSAVPILGICRQSRCLARVEIFGVALETDDFCAVARQKA